VRDAAASEAVEWFARADLDESGSLDFAEFTAALTTANASGLAAHSTRLSASTRGIGEMEARLWFAALDHDRIGRVDICAWLELLLGDGRSPSSADRAASSAHEDVDAAGDSFFRDRKRGPPRPTTSASAPSSSPPRRTAT